MATPDPDGWTKPKSAFAYPNYRRYWFAALARVFGIQFRIIGAGWLVVSELDREPVWLGVVGIASAVPTIILSVPAGVLADRIDNWRVLLVGQVLSFGAHLSLAVLIVTDVVQLWIVIVWAVVSGAFTALATPAQNAILPRLIDMSAMPSAVAFNSSIWNSMRIIGPAGAGVLIAAIGTGQAFFVTAGGFAVSIVLIARLRLEPVQAAAHGGRGGGMSEGFRYIVSEPIFLATVGLSFFTSVFGSSYAILLPVFADDVLEVGAGGFGFMEAGAGVGALAGLVAIVKIGVGRHAGPVMLGSAGMFGLLVAVFAASRSLALSIALLFLAGFFSSVYLNLGMTTLQVLVPDQLRGRVMGVWSMTWFLSSVGGFVAGVVATLLGVPWTVAIGGLSVSVFSLALLVASPELRAMGDVTEQHPRPAAAT